MRAVMAIILTSLALVPTLQTAQKDLVMDVSLAVFESGKMQTFAIKLRNLGEETLENVTVKIASEGKPITISGISE